MGLFFLFGNLDCLHNCGFFTPTVEVGTTASGCAVQTNGVMSIPGLRWDNPLTRCAFNDLGVVGDTNSSELSLIHGDLPSSVGKGRGRLGCAGLLRCHERLAGYDPGRVLAHPAGSDGGGGGTRTHKPGQAAVLKTAVFAVSPHPQLKFIFSSRFLQSSAVYPANPQVPAE